MYLYYDQQGKLQTAIAHGSPIRQGDSFGLYVCFDPNYFKNNENLTGSELLYMAYKKSGDNSWTPFTALENIGTIKFKKAYDSEVTYKLVDNSRYLTFYVNIEASTEITAKCGDLGIVFSFQGAGMTYRFNATTGLYEIVNDQNDGTGELDATTNTVNLSAQLYVEPTYGKAKPVLDNSIDMDNYNTLTRLIERIAAEKNIFMETMISSGENSSLQSRATFMLDKWKDTRIGWAAISVRKTITQDVEENTYSEQITDTDFYIILDENTIFAIEGATGSMYMLSSGNWIQLSYTKEFLDELLNPSVLRQFLNTNSGREPYQTYHDLSDAIRDFYNRIVATENNSIYDIKYENNTIKAKKGDDPNGVYTPVVDKTGLGITDIETNAAYDVKYENDTIKFRKGKDANGNYTDVANKNDLGITNIENNAIYSVEYGDGNFKVQKGLNGAKQVIAETSQIVQNNSEYLASTKAVFDALEEGAKVSNAKNPNLEKFNEAMQKIQYMYDYFNENTEDVDNKINKLEEIIAVLDNLPENYSIFETIENIYNKLGEDKDDSFFYDESWTNEDKARFSVKGRIQELEHNADSHIMVFMRYADNQQLFTIPTTAWATLAEPYTNYPDATCYATIQNNEFKDILDMEIIFDKAVEKELIAGIEVDTTTGVITFYALETPEIAITIDTIKIISNLYHTNSLSLDTIAQVEENKNNLILANQEISALTRNVNNINNVELPKYVEKQIDDSNCRTSIENVNETNDRRISLVYKEGNDENWGINNSVNVFASGIFLSTYKVEDENEIIHYLRLTNNGELTLDGVELQTKGNLTSLFQATPDDTHYPSEKLVKDSLDAIKNTTVGGVNLTSSTTNLQNYKYDIVQQTVDALVTGNYTLPQTYDLTQFVIPEEGQSYLVSTTDCGIGVTITHTSFDIYIANTTSGTNPGLYRYMFNDNKWYYNDSTYTGSINTFFNATTSNGVLQGQEETMKLILGVQDTTVNVDRTLKGKIDTLAEKNEVPTLRTTTGAINTVDNVIQTETRYMSGGSSAKIGDYLLDKVSVVIKGLYKIISFESSSYSDSRLAILSLVGTFEEAKYQHLIKIDAKTVSGYTSKLHIKIVNSDPLDWTTSKLKAWLNNNNYTNGTVCPYFDGWIRKDSSWEEIAISGIGLDSNSKIVAEIYLDSATLSTIVLEDTLFSISDKKTKI